MRYLRIAALLPLARAYFAICACYTGVNFTQEPRDRLHLTTTLYLLTGLNG